jgi:hypothetical protein
MVGENVIPTSQTKNPPLMVCENATHMKNLKTHYLWLVEMQHPYDKLKNPLFMGIKYAIHPTL